MESLWILIPLSLVIAIGIGAAFWWAVSGGQMDDLNSPGRRILIDDDLPPATAHQSDGSSSQALQASQADPAGDPPSSQKVLPVV